MNNSDKKNAQVKSLNKHSEIDELDFSPITEGLGFHQKVEVSSNRARDLAIQRGRSIQSTGSSHTSIAIDNDQLSVFYKSSNVAEIRNEQEINMVTDQVTKDVHVASFVASVMMDLSISALIYFALNLVIAVTLSSFVSFNLIFSHFLRENYLMLPIIYFFYNSFFIRINNSTAGFRYFKMRFVSFNGKEDFSFSLLASLYLLLNALTLGLFQMMSLSHIFKVAIVYERN